VRQKFALTLIILTFMSEFFITLVVLHTEDDLITGQNICDLC